MGNVPIAIIGYATNDGPRNPKTKGATYKKTRQLVERFDGQNGSTLCKELKGLIVWPVLRSYPDCIDDSIRMTLDILNASKRRKRVNPYTLAAITETRDSL